MTRLYHPWEIKDLLNDPERSDSDKAFKLCLVVIMGCLILTIPVIAAIRGIVLLVQWFST